MIHLIKNYYAAPNNMGFTLLKEKNRKDKKGNTTYETLGYCGNFEEVIILLKRRAVNDRLSEIADDLDIHIQTVRRHIAELMEDGLLATDHSGTPRTIRVTGYKFKKERER